MRANNTPPKSILALTLLVLWAAGCSDDGTSSPPDSAVPDAAVSDTAVSDAALDTLAPDAPPGLPKLVVLHTNDIHGHLEGLAPNVDYTPDTSGNDTTEGGFARLAARIAEERAAAGSNPVLLLDAGDFTMGTLFTWLEPTDAPALSLMQAMGYDAITLGNHEFEWGAVALGSILEAGVKAGLKAPILASNMVLDTTDPGDDKLEALVASGAIKPKLVKTLPNGIKVGLFGLMGEHAAMLSAAGAPVTFDDIVEVAKKLIKELRDDDKVDLVICLSHTGQDAVSGATDVDLAKQAPGIDVIISGHTHHELTTPLKEGQTLIVQTAKYGRKLGKLELTFKDKAVESSSYDLIPLDDESKGDATIQGKVDDAINAIDGLLQPANLSYDAVIAETSFDLDFPYFAETRLGNLVTDAYLKTHNALYPGDPADCAIDAGGFIRDPLLKGKTGAITFADLYRTVPLGIGPDGQPGSPLVSLYLNGVDIKTVAEMIPYAAKNKDQILFLQVSGMQVEYQTNGLPLFSVNSVKIGDPPQEVDFWNSTKCYKVLVNYYVASMLSLVEKVSGGLVKVEAKEADCSTVVTDMTTRLVDADPAAAGVQELKVWQALIDYLSTFPDTDSDGIPDVPAAYSQLQNRIVAK